MCIRRAAVFTEPFFGIIISIKVMRLRFAGRQSMVWGYDYSARLVVDIVLLVIILSVHFIRLYIKKRKAQRNGFEAAENASKK